VFVDLAHAHPESFWDAVDAHDGRLPLLSTHTGVSGVYPSWRNLDDRQLRAIADTGGVVGIIYSSFFLVPRGREDGVRMVVEHMEHAIRVAGEEHVGLGTDYDGFIIPPPDLRSADSYPRLVQAMLDAGWSERRIARVLGGNFLRAFGEMRPG
jgi:membrane dipeptidase